MNASRCFTSALVACTLALITLPDSLIAQSDSLSARRQAEFVAGQHDFDFELGTWKTHLRRLLRPLTGSTTWVEYEGTTVVRPVWGGAANIVELKVDGAAGHFEGLSLRLFNPQSRQWSLNFANRSSGTLALPTIGGFNNGRGEFHDQEEVNGRVVLVRFVILVDGPDQCRFEQSYSTDGGRTWEVNWKAVDTRVAERRGNIGGNPPPH
jgi:hypothetical protein